MIHLGRFRFRLIAETPILLPIFYGQTLRGGLATVMRRTVCVTHRPSCEGCLLRCQCAYGVLFEPIPPPAAPQPRYATAPRPYVLRVPFDPRKRTPHRYEPGEAIAFELVLVGPATYQLPYFIYALLELGQRGLGRGRGRFRLARVVALAPGGDEREVFNGETLYGLSPPWTAEAIVNAFALPDAQRLAVRFLTPTRLDLNGDLVFPIAFHDLARGLVNRLRTLERFYGSRQEGGDKTGALLDAARDVRLRESTQRWIDLERFSTRQKTRLKMGGVVGEAVYEARDFAPFAPLLALGQWLHAGKLTTMGLGKFEIMR
jgi:hypothetical protein